MNCVKCNMMIDGTWEERDNGTCPQHVIAMTNQQLLETKGLCTMKSSSYESTNTVLYRAVLRKDGDSF